MDNSCCTFRQKARNWRRASSADDSSYPPLWQDLAYQPIKAFGSSEIIGVSCRDLATTSGMPSVEYWNAVFADIARIHRELSHQPESRPWLGHSVSSDLFVALPISFEMIKDEAVRQALVDAGKTHDLPYGALVLELFDLAKADNNKLAKRWIGELHNAGLRLAFAENSAEKSILGNLHRYNFDYIRLSGALLQQAQADEKAALSVRTLLTLGRDLGLRVIAEHLDAPEDLRLAQEFGCHYGQGDALQSALFVALMPEGPSIVELSQEKDGGYGTRPKCCGWSNL